MGLKGGLNVGDVDWFFVGCWFFVKVEICGIDGFCRFVLGR